MAGQRRPRQIVEAPAARLAFVAPQKPFRPVEAAPDGLPPAAVRAVHAFPQAQLSDALVALSFTDQVVD